MSVIRDRLRAAAVRLTELAKRSSPSISKFIRREAAAVRLAESMLEGLACERCNGTGERDNEDCTMCLGKGEL